MGVFVVLKMEFYKEVCYNKLSYLCYKFQMRGLTMIKNNIELDVKVKCIEQGTTQTQIADDIGTTKSYVNRIIKKPEGVVNKTFVQMMESLGYDIELTYVKRGTADEG